MFVSAIIAAAGRGTRLGADEPKQLVEIGGVPMLQRTVDTFVRAACVNEIIIALPPDVAHAPPSYLRHRRKPLHVVPGGVRRQDSVANAFARVSMAADVVVVHDAARPFATEALISRTVEAAYESGAAIAALPASDTVKQSSGVGEDPTVDRTLPRERIFLAQTPQAFRREVLRDAIALARDPAIDVTDEATLAERAGHTVRLVAGEPQNVKITTANDLRAARGTVFSEAERVLVRIGTGYDLHRLVEGRPFILADVTIPFEKGPLGHSDADVLCHAVADAVLGAASIGDIGHHFPDSDERWRGAPGLDLLARAIDLVRRRGFIVVNIDAVVIAERPKLAAHMPAICSNLARALNVAAEAVSVKGKTNEGVGELGRGEAIACHAIALLTKK